MQRLLERRHAGVRPRSRVRAFQRRRRPASSGVVAVLNDEGPVGGQTTRCAALFCVHRVDFDVVTVQVPRSKVCLWNHPYCSFFLLFRCPQSFLWSRRAPVVSPGCTCWSEWQPVSPRVLVTFSLIDSIAEDRCRFKVGQDQLFVL